LYILFISNLEKLSICFFLVNFINSFILTVFVSFLLKISAIDSLKAINLSLFSGSIAFIIVFDILEIGLLFFVYHFELFHHFQLYSSKFFNICSA
jgi:hypothetical protein